MSFFNKLFGGNDQKSNAQPKNQPPPKPKEESVEAKKIKIEAACNTLDAKIN